MTRQERERSRLITIIVGVVVGLAIIALVGGLLWQSVVTPRASVAVVNGDRITTSDLAKRAQYDHLQRESNLRNLLNYQQQIDPGGQQGFFTSQIQQLQSDLIDNEGLTNKVLELMIEEKLIRQLAEKNGVTASDAEIQAKLELVVAAQNSSVTAPEATATAEALGCGHSHTHVHAQPNANYNRYQHGSPHADCHTVAYPNRGGADGRRVHATLGHAA